MRDFNIEQQINDFFASGGTVKQVAEGERSAPASLRYCRCGCRGDYTDHSMRAGESGRSSSQVVR